MTGAFGMVETHLRGKRILLVDDERELADMVATILHGAGFASVDIANSSAEALSSIAARSASPEHAYQLFVLDVMMPGMDGFELCRRSKAELLTCHIPFLLLTAKGDEENRAEGYSAGADGYIAKPFSIKTLRTRVNSLIEQRIKLRERYRQKLLTDPSEIQIESENDKFIDTLVKAIEQNIDNSEFGIQELCADFALLLPAGLPQGQGAHRGVDQRIHPHRAAQTGGAIPRAKRHPHLGDHV